MKKLKDFLMIENNEAYIESIFQFLNYFLKNLNDPQLEKLIQKKDILNVFEYLWTHYKNIFTNKDIQLIFERYLLIKSGNLTKMDIVLNLAKLGIYVKADEINITDEDIEENCLEDDDKKIYNIHTLIKKVKERLNK